MYHHFISIRLKARLLPLLILHLLAGVAAGQTEIDELRSEVRELRETVSTMAVRIAALEARLDQPSAPAPTASWSQEEPSLIQRLANRTRYPNGVSDQPWYTPEAWTRLQLGMSTEQVIEILGTPTFDEPSLNRTIDRVLTFQARDAHTQHKVRGKVKFKRDQVVTIEPPQFP